MRLEGSLAQMLSQAYHWVLKVTEKLGDGFIVAPWRWVVERTFSWLDKSRRLCRDYDGRKRRGFLGLFHSRVEVIPENHEAFVYIVMIRLMLRRLTDNRRKRRA